MLNGLQEENYTIVGIGTTLGGSVSADSVGFFLNKNAVWGPRVDFAKRSSGYYIAVESWVVETLHEKFSGWVPRFNTEFNKDHMMSSGHKLDFDENGIATSGEIRYYPEIPVTKCDFNGVSRLEELLDFIPEFHKVSYLPRKGYTPGFKKFNRRRFFFADIHSFYSLLDLRTSSDDTSTNQKGPLIYWGYETREEMLEKLVDPELIQGNHDLNSLIASFHIASINVKEIVEFIGSTQTFQEDVKGRQVIHGDLKVENLLLTRVLSDHNILLLLEEMNKENGKRYYAGKNGHLAVSDWEKAKIGLRYQDITRLLQSKGIEILTGGKTLDEDAQMEFLAKYIARFHGNYIQEGKVTMSDWLNWLGIQLLGSDKAHEFKNFIGQRISEFRWNHYREIESLRNFITPYINSLIDPFYLAREYLNAATRPFKRFATRTIDNLFYEPKISNQMLLEAEPLYWAQGYIDNLRIAKAFLTEKGLHRSADVPFYLAQAETCYKNFLVARENLENKRMGRLEKYIPLKKENVIDKLLGYFMPNSYHASTKIRDL